jgi:protein-tyrosine phosphatase
VREHGLQDRLVIDSAGTHGYHIGEPPDPRSIQIAQARGVMMSDLRARQFERADFDNFDLILAMDQSHLDHIERMAQTHEGARAQHCLFLDFAPDAGRADVPDPYYGGTREFEYALDLVQRGVDGLLRYLQRESL